MSNKIGRFEILSELSHSDASSVYKATDTGNSQTVALKVVRLETLGEQGAVLVKGLLEEAQASKVLNSPNIAKLNDAEEVDGLFCASLEYVQGNSVGTMLARKEGFSIWDLQDIARQTCQGLDHAQAKGMVHYTLEPAKIMVSWDGTVKILGFGISTINAFAAQASGNPPTVLHYMSPEQLSGDSLTAASNIFSLGAIFYEMVTERKAFDGQDADQVRQSISEMTPVAPDQINRKLHPALSQVIMKSLAKDPAERYASGQDLVNDLEKCKESASKAAAAAKPGATVPKAALAAAVTARGASAVKAAAPAPKAAAAATGGNGSKSSSAAGLITPNLDAAAPVLSKSAAAAQSFSVQSSSSPSASMSSAATVEPEYEAPAIKVDPSMDESRPAGAGATRSFSEIDELPPLKEVYVAPPPPSSEPDPVAAVPVTVFKGAPPEKPKIQPREVAKKAVTEIRKTPPKLFAISVAVALAIIVAVVAMMAWHIHTENADDDAGPVQNPAPAAAAQPSPAQAAPAVAISSVPTAVQVTPEPVTTEPREVSVQPKYNTSAKKKGKTRPTAPAIVPGELSINTTPQGAQIQIDGRSSSGWVTPFNVGGLNPGQHTLTISKLGYAPETRNIEVGSGSKSFISVQLAGLTATASVTTDPAGAAIWMDGKDTGRVTPAQLSVDKAGNHAFVFKKQGFLDETSATNLQIGQTTRLTATLQPLANADNIKIGGKFKKMFGGGDTAGMGAVSIKTQPKGAQIAVNNRIVDKNSPVDLYLDPGNYIVDITMSGFKSVHRVINVGKNGKVVIDENLDRE